MVKTEGLGSSGLPEAVAFGCGRAAVAWGVPPGRAPGHDALQCSCQAQHRSSWRLNQSLICIRNFLFILMASVTGCQMPSEPLLCSV